MTTPRTYPVILFDGNGIAFRAFKGADGDTVGSTLWRLLESAERWRPDVMVMAWDAPDSREARLKYLPEYKADRPPKDPDFFEGVATLERLLPLLGILQCKVPRVEADDSLYSMSLEHERCLIYSADKDLLQALIGGVDVYRPAMGNTPEQLVNLDNCETVTGLKPSDWTGYLALCGDKSDNIPGIKGLGDKTAKKILEVAPTFITDALGGDMMETALINLHEHAPKLAKWFDKAIGPERPNLEASYNAVQLIYCETDEHMIPAAPDRAAAERAMLDLGCSDRLIGKWSAITQDASGDF